MVTPKVKTRLSKSIAKVPVGSRLEISFVTLAYLTMRLNGAVLQIRLQNFTFPLGSDAQSLFSCTFYTIRHKVIVTLCSPYCSNCGETITNIQSIGQLDKMNT